MSKRYDNLFTFIMEADEIPEFDFGDAGGDAVPDTAGDAANASPETSDPASGGDPPELSQDNMDEFNFNPEGEDTTDMGDMSESNKIKRIIRKVKILVIRQMISSTKDSIEN